MMNIFGTSESTRFLDDELRHISQFETQFGDSQGKLHARPLPGVVLRLEETRLNKEPHTLLYQG
jgi:hypothetical protein